MATRTAACDSHTYPSSSEQHQQVLGVSSATPQLCTGEIYYDLKRVRPTGSQPKQLWVGFHPPSCTSHDPVIVYSRRKDSNVTVPGGAVRTMPGTPPAPNRASGPSHSPLVQLRQQHGSIGECRSQVAACTRHTAGFLELSPTVKSEI